MGLVIQGDLFRPGDFILDGRERIVAGMSETLHLQKGCARLPRFMVADLGRFGEQSRVVSTEILPPSGSPDGERPNRGPKNVTASGYIPELINSDYVMG